MKAYVVNKWLKDVSDLELKQVPDPKCPEDGLVVKILATGLEFYEILQIKGQYQYKPAFPFVPGSQFAGIVVEVGPKQSNFKLGEKVFGSKGGIDVWAEKIALTGAITSRLHRVPSNLTMGECLTVQSAFPTSYVALTTRGEVKKGEVVLVHAAAGGIGLAAVQLAKYLGAFVIATCGSDDKCKVALREGADHAINYTKEKDWPALVNEITKKIPGRRWVGADVVIDPVGLVIPSTKCIAWNGRIVVVGFTSGSIENVPANRLLLKNASVVGIHLGAYSIHEPEVPARAWTEIFDILATNKFKPAVYTEQKFVGLESIPKALADLGARKTWGKVIVEYEPNAETYSARL
ncbi:hypothetical protein SmJEL517_g06139 [Synchytrium microbalum]|uniref:Enoyl reductase (ER) domain-containing protein n=1 Tax=Synchytrium microbalum TaxID=1806994 RepID=A0A507BH81_9FUNG|nr:uncharacterized protein SmJEL517_g06139 [Synchytrium microbalum]TPX30270.1 hypothetical protein SmJEL517_g06139 [Synchytrium microbalum]